MSTKEELWKLLEEAKWNEEDIDDEFSDPNYEAAIERSDELMRLNTSKLDICIDIVKHQDQFNLTKDQYSYVIVHNGCEDYLPEEYLEVLRLEGLIL